MMSLTHTLPRNLLSTVGRTLTTRNVARRVQACSISTASQASHRPGSPASPFVSRRPTSLQNPACPTGVRHKSKRSRASAVENVDEPRVGDEDVPVMNTKGKGAKAAKSGSRGTKSKRGDVEQAEVEDDSRYQTSTKNDELPDEKYHEEAVKANMRRAVERCKNTVTKMIGMQGRADPGECLFVRRDGSVRLLAYIAMFHRPRTMQPCSTQSEYGEMKARRSIR